MRFGSDPEANRGITAGISHVPFLLVPHWSVFVSAICITNFLLRICTIKFYFANSLAIEQHLTVYARKEYGYWWYCRSG